MYETHGFGELSKKHGRIGFGIGSVFGKMIEEFSSVDQFHGKIVVEFVPVQIVKLDNVLMGSTLCLREHLQGSDFAFKVGLTGIFAWHGFQRHLESVRLSTGLVDHAVGTLPQELQDFVFLFETKGLLLLLLLVLVLVLVLLFLLLVVFK